MRCAIYTRKSTEKGLEQDFNTLDAQREACLAYITSQKSEGWKPIKTHYNDGGFSGGNIERPALQKLIEDIKDHKIDIIVVYKIDRLTRALMDFSKLVEIFDAHKVSFVSITQSFNTTTSMGRLTLNVLLSFAQFEREVIGERIRDKIAASKKKGMWMGGHPPLGYDIIDRKLIINKQEAKDIQYIFSRYLELETILKLKTDLEKVGIKSKTWTSRNDIEHKGKPYGYGALHHLITNPIYAGYIRHKKEISEGLHEAIISRELWQKVQNKLQSHAKIKRGHKKAKSSKILKGKLFDNEGNLYTPTHSNKQGKKYCYYINNNCPELNKTIKRLPAHEIEILVINSITSELENINKLSLMLGLNIETHHHILSLITTKAQSIKDMDKVINNVVIDTEQLTVNVNIKTLAELISNSLDINLETNIQSHAITTPYHTQRARKGAIVINVENKKDVFDLPRDKLKKLVQGTIWRDEHFKGASLKALARREGYSDAYVRSAIVERLEFL